MSATRPPTENGDSPLGATVVDGGTRFQVWAPTRRHVEVVIETTGASAVGHPLTRMADGVFAATIADIGAGTRYRYRLDGEGPYPDPASRFQPEGVHGPSQVIDPRTFVWSDAGWNGLSLEELIIYELHVGTFTPAGTFAGALERLPYLRDLGITAIEIMPVAAFAGERNWGYDGVSLFAPARCYGRPDDLRRLVDAAHSVGLGVILDVVYNHFGPDGAYLDRFSPHYFTDRHRTPWGAAVNLDGAYSQMVRRFFIENAQHWLNEYHFDGLRLDATHALVDDSPRHFLAELAARVHSEPSRPRRHPPLLIAEDHRNLAQMVRSPSAGGWGLDAVWADDFHHHVRRCLAGDNEGYYQDYTGSTADIAETIRGGWFFHGQQSVYSGKPRGTSPAGIPPARFVICIQNHDQIGNRALGERLHHQIDAAAYRAASVLLLCAPQTPLLFMGQEWSASTPFLFFTDHHADLGTLVTEGRRREFSRFSAFADAATRERIPDPQSPTTFERSRLNWDETNAAAHAATMRIYRALLALRRADPALGSASSVDCLALSETAVGLRRQAPDGSALTIIVQLRGGCTIDLGAHAALRSDAAARRLVLNTEDPAFCLDPMAIRLDGAILRFARPGAVILRAER